MLFSVALVNLSICFNPLHMSCYFSHFVGLEGKAASMCPVSQQQLQQQREVLRARDCVEAGLECCLQFICVSRQWTRSHTCPLEDAFSAAGVQHPLPSTQHPPNLKILAGTRNTLRPQPSTLVACANLCVCRWQALTACGCRAVATSTARPACRQRQQQRWTVVQSRICAAQSPAAASCCRPTL
jgi:hypothetical protein